MPMYDFQCKECGYIYETMLKLSDPLPTVCPKCNKPALEKQVGSGGFILKGPGWFKTDGKY